MRARERAIVRIAALGAMGLVALGLGACGEGNGGGGEGSGDQSVASSSEVTAEITPEARAEAQQIFQTRCSACHGTTGHGDGPGAASLVPPPRNYHDPAWQDSVTDEEIEKAIVYGGAAVGRSPAMVGNPDLASKPSVVAALREIVRSFGKQP